MIQCQSTEVYTWLYNYVATDRRTQFYSVNGHLQFG